VETKPRLSVECTVHPSIRPAEKIDVAPPLDAQEARIVDLVLQHALMALSPSLTACVDRQRKILDAFRNDDLSVQIEKGDTLAELVKSAKLTQADVKPGVAEWYVLEPEGDAAVLECTVHYSLQRMTAKQDGVDLLEVNPGR
jgi:hypothetical protein